MEKNPKLRLTHLTFLIIQLNSVIDGGLHEGVGLAEAKEAIRTGTVFSWLGQRFSGQIDVSIYGANSDARDGISKALQDLLGGYDGSERRKWGVENNGIAAPYGYASSGRACRFGSFDMLISPKDRRYCWPHHITRISSISTS